MLDDERGTLRADPRLLPINYRRRAAEADDAAEVLLVDDADGAGSRDAVRERAKGPTRRTRAKGRSAATRSSGARAGLDAWRIFLAKWPTGRRCRASRASYVHASRVLPAKAARRNSATASMELFACAPRRLSSGFREAEEADRVEARGGAARRPSPRPRRAPRPQPVLLFDLGMLASRAGLHAGAGSPTPAARIAARSTSSRTAPWLRALPRGAAPRRQEDGRRRAGKPPFVRRVYPPPCVRSSNTAVRAMSASTRRCRRTAARCTRCDEDAGRARRAGRRLERAYLARRLPTRGRAARRRRPSCSRRRSGRGARARATVSRSAPAQGVEEARRRAARPTRTATRTTVGGAEALARIDELVRRARTPGAAKTEARALEAGGLPSASASSTCSRASGTRGASSLGCRASRRSTRRRPAALARAHGGRCRGRRLRRWRRRPRRGAAAAAVRRRLLDRQRHASATTPVGGGVGGGGAGRGVAPVLWLCFLDRLVRPRASAAAPSPAPCGGAAASSALPATTAAERARAPRRAPATPAPGARLRWRCIEPARQAAGAIPAEAESKLLAAVGAAAESPGGAGRRCSCARCASGSSDRRGGRSGRGGGGWRAAARRRASPRRTRGRVRGAAPAARRHRRRRAPRTILRRRTSATIIWRRCDHRSAVVGSHGVRSAARANC